MENPLIEELLKTVDEFLQSEKGNLSSAVHLATEFSTKNSISPDSLLELCYSCLLNERDLAYIFAKTCASLSTGDIKVNSHCIAGVTSDLMGYWREAEEQYKLALEIDPRHVNTHSYYGTLLIKMRRYEEAETEYKLALDVDPKSVVIHNNYGILLSEIERYEEAKEQYRLALEADPINAESHYNYAILLGKIKNWKEAEEHYNLAQKANPSDADIHYNYGILLAEMGCNEEAEIQYKLALKNDPKHVASHYSYGILLSERGQKKEAEEQYKLALENDPKHVATHYIYGILLLEMGRKKEAGEQYKLALEYDPKHVATHSACGNLLLEMGQKEEAEKQYKLALETDPENVSTLCNYGNFLLEVGRQKEAEEQYKLALEFDPKHVVTHSNYGNLLRQIGLPEEAEEQFKIAIGLDPKLPNSHGAYGLLLFSMNLEEKAIEETKKASRLFRENGDRVKEHLSLAWIYEEFANKYYNLEDYQKSGEYAEISADEYIEAGKYAGEEFKGTSLTKGYTLKGRAKIRTLEIKTPFYKDLFNRIWNRNSYGIEKFTKVIDCIMDASRCYEKAAEVSPKDNQLCSACSISMSCLSEMLDYTLAVIKQEKTPQLEDKLKNWNEKMANAKNVYKEHSKGELFIESLYKLMGCIQNLDKYKKHGTREYGRAFEECRKELSEIANNIEGPLQKIIEDSAKQMNLCRLKIMPYAGTETGYIPQPSKLHQFSKWISDPKRIIVGVAGIILTVIVNHYSEYLFYLIKRFVTMLLSKI